MPLSVLLSSGGRQTELRQRCGMQLCRISARQMEASDFTKLSARSQTAACCYLGLPAITSSPPHKENDAPFPFGARIVQGRRAPAKATAASTSPAAAGSLCDAWAHISPSRRGMSFFFSQGTDLGADFHMEQQRWWIEGRMGSAVAKRKGLRSGSARAQLRNCMSGTAWA